MILFDHKILTSTSSAAGDIIARAAARSVSTPEVVLDVRVGGQRGVLLPPARIQQHAVPIVLVHWLHLFVAPLCKSL